MAARPSEYPKLGDLNALDFTTGKISAALRNYGYGDGVKLPAAQFNELMNEINQWVQYLDIISETGTFNAVFATSKTLVVTYIKFSNNLVKLWWPELTGLDGGTDHPCTGTPVPASIRPSATRVVNVPYVPTYNGNVWIQADGAMNLYVGSSTSVFNSAVVEYIL